MPREVAVRALSLFALLLVINDLSGPMDAAAESAAPNVRWSFQPTSEDIAAVYPHRAARLGHYGRVEMSCSVLADGSLARCVADSEDPPNEGFAEAALKLAKYYRLAPDAAASMGAARVEIPIRFSLAP